MAILTICFYLDEYIRELFSTIHYSLTDEVFALGAHLYGETAVNNIYFPVILLWWFLIAVNHDFRIIGLKILESFAFSGVIVTIIKSIVGTCTFNTEHGTLSFVPFTFGTYGYLSFPSADVAVAFAFSVIIAGIFENKLWKIFWYLLAVLTSLGRIYHDQHWLSDVTAAAAISIYVGIYINNFHRNKKYIIN